MGNYRSGLTIRTFPMFHFVATMDPMPPLTEPKHLHYARIIDVDHEIFIGLVPNNNSLISNGKGPNRKGPNEKGPNEKGPNRKDPNEKSPAVQAIRFRYHGKIYRLKKCTETAKTLTFEYESNASLTLTKTKRVVPSIGEIEERMEMEERPDSDIHITAFYPESDAPVQIQMSLFARKLFTPIEEYAEEYNKIAGFIGTNPTTTTQKQK